MWTCVVFGRKCPVIGVGGFHYVSSSFLHFPAPQSFLNQSWAIQESCCSEGNLVLFPKQSSEQTSCFRWECTGNGKITKIATAVILENARAICLQENMVDKCEILAIFNQANMSIKLDLVKIKKAPIPTASGIRSEINVISVQSL